MGNSVIGLIGIAGHYFTNFIDTLLKDDSGFFHILVGILLHHDDWTAGHCYIFSGAPGTGKTSIMRILGQLFETNSAVILIDDLDPNKVQIDPAKTYFITTNLPAENIHLKNSTVFEMSGIRFPKKVYQTYMRDFELYTDAYKLICDSEYRLWATDWGVHKSI